MKHKCKRKMQILDTVEMCLLGYGILLFFQMYNQRSTVNFYIPLISIPIIVGYYLFTKKMYHVHLGCIAIFALEYILAIGKHQTFAKYLILALTMIFVFVYCWNRYWSNMYHYAFDAQDSNVQISSRIFAANRMQIGIFLLIVVFLLGSVFIVNPDRLNEPIANTAKNTLETALKAYDIGDKPYKKVKKVKPVQKKKIEAPKEQPHYVYILNVIILALLFFVMLLAIIYKIYNMFKNSMGNMLEENDEIEIIDDDLEQTLKEKGVKKKPTFWNRSQENQIRYRFYKEIQSYRKKGVRIRNSQTPKQMGNVILEETNQDISQLVNDYERVRYR